MNCPFLSVNVRKSFTKQINSQKNHFTDKNAQLTDIDKKRLNLLCTINELFNQLKRKIFFTKCEWYCDFIYF